MVSAGDVFVMPSVFISYRRDDSIEVVGRIYDRLVANFGHGAVFRDLESIPLGSDFRTEMVSALDRCEILIVIIGPTWIECRSANGFRRLDEPHDYVRMEIEYALERKLRIIPLLVMSASMPAPDQLPASLRLLAFLNCIPIRADPDFNSDVSRLIEGIDLGPKTKAKRKVKLQSATRAWGIVLLILISLCLVISIASPALKNAYVEFEARTFPRQQIPKDSQTAKGDTSEGVTSEQDSQETAKENTTRGVTSKQAGAKPIDYFTVGSKWSGIGEYTKGVNKEQLYGHAWELEVTKRTDENFEGTISYYSPNIKVPGTYVIAGRAPKIGIGKISFEMPEARRQYQKFEGVIDEAGRINAKFTGKGPGREQGKQDVEGTVELVKHRSIQEP